jgi:hypothetical protein
MADNTSTTTTTDASGNTTTIQKVETWAKNEISVVETWLGHLETVARTSAWGSAAYGIYLAAKHFL